MAWFAVVSSSTITKPRLRISSDSFGDVLLHDPSAQLFSERFAIPRRYGPSRTRREMPFPAHRGKTTP